MSDESGAVGLSTDSSREQELAINHALGVVTDDIVAKAEKVIRSYRGGLSREDATRSPFRSLLILAARPDTSKRALQNYLHYQLGKRNSGDVWRVKGEKGENFAVGLSKQLDELEPIVDQVCTLTEKLTSSTLLPERVAGVRMRVIQLFLGYVSRSHVAVAGRTKH